MTNSRTAKFLASAAGLAMALSFTANVGAVTVADLQAQVAALMAQISAMSGGSSSSHAFNTDLSVGSTGADVVALQSLLISKGYLTMPAGVAQGTFGPLTKSAVAKWQASAGIAPAAGFFGPKSRAAVNAMGGVVGGTSTGGTVGSTGATGITTPGAEGTLTVTAGVISNSTVYSGDVAAPILAFKAKALNSDIAIQRVKIDLGTVSNIYSKVYSKIYLVDDAGNTVASSDLNSSTVVKDSDNIYYVTLSGFSSVVPKDATRNYTVKVDVRSLSSGSTDLTSHTVRLAANGVRGVDGAGIDQYSPVNATDVSKSVTANATLADSATLALSTSASTPLSQEIVASGGSGSNEADKVALLSFDIRAEKDNVLVTDLVVTVSRTAGAATASTTYLMDGSTVIGSASASGSTVTFNDINYTVPKATTKTLTIASDIRSAGATATTITASVASNGLTAENSNGDSVSGTSVTGSATSNNIIVRNIGPVFTLLSKTITTSGVPEIDGSSNTSYSTSTLAATFTVQVKALGAAITFGTTASGTPAFASSTTGFKVYRNSTYDALISSVSTSTDYAVPSSGVSTAGLSNSFTLAQNNTITIPVTFTIQGRNAAGTALTRGSTYSVGLEGIQWTSAATGPTSSTFMAGLTDWRTSGVSFP